MTLRILLSCIIPVLLSFTRVAGKSPKPQAGRSYTVITDSLDLFDSSRNRLIPTAFYIPDKAGKHLPVIVLSHGYGRNQPGSNKAYSYLANALAAQGYLVISIQHELPGDPLIAMTGRLLETRMPDWERGVDNIIFTLRQLALQRPGPDYTHPILIGHSNGGDMSMLFAHRYPDIPKSVITLDNRRMPLPRVRKPRISSLRSSDQEADSMVIPTAAEQKKYRIRILCLSVPHNDMDDDATEPQRKEIISNILNLLNDN